MNTKIYLQITLVLFLFPSTIYAQSYYKEIPFEVEDSKIYIEAFINDKPYRFLLDTGVTGYGRIDTGLVADLEIPITGTDSIWDGTNTSVVDKVTVDKMSFADITFENVNLLCRSFNRRPRKDKKRYYGIIGQRFWQEYVMEVDYKQKKLIFSDVPLSKDDENTISYTRNFVISFKVADVDVEGHVDTGSPFTLLFPTEYTKKFDVSELREAGTAQSANTIFTYSLGTILDTVSMAGNEVSDFTTVYSDIIGHVNIGMAFLKHFNLTIDQKNKLIKLKKYER